MTEFEKGLLKYFCKEDLKKIQQTKIGIAGAGGLGSNCAMLLVRSGFIHFTIVDFDRVEVSNLNRQNYVYSQVNQSKVAALKENLAQIHSNVQIEAVEDRLTRDNIKEIFSSCDIVIEAVDCPEKKAMIIEELAQAGKYIVAASGLAGWGNSDRIKVKKINDRLYIVGDLISTIENNPPCAPVVTLTASKQADLVLGIVLQ